MGTVTSLFSRKLTDELSKLRQEMAEIRGQIRTKNCRYLEVCKRIGEIKDQLGLHDEP